MIATNQTIELKVKLQKILYQTRDNDLGEALAPLGEKRITIKEAEQLLVDREIEYSDVLKIRYEHVILEMTPEEIESFIVL